MKKIRQGFLQIGIVASLCLTGAIIFASDTDERIESSAKASYVFRSYLQDENINIESKDGAVTLTGTVSEESQKTLANEMVANLPGVKSVDNKLGLKGAIPAAYSDAWLITKVKSTLLFHKNVSGTATEVFAEKGVVTLRGKATTTAQKDLVTEYAMDVEGVKSVNNEMIVVPDVRKPGEITVSEKVDTSLGAVDDVSITALVKTTLFYHRSTSALNTLVTTKDGVVNLEGSVKNAAEKALVTKLVMDVNGVKGVVNNMTIN